MRLFQTLFEEIEAWGLSLKFVVGWCILKCFIYMLNVVNQRHNIISCSIFSQYHQSILCRRWTFVHKNIEYIYIHLFIFIHTQKIEDVAVLYQSFILINQCHRIIWSFENSNQLLIFQTSILLESSNILKILTMTLSLI